MDCVEGGESVSFMHPLTPDRAVAFWQHGPRAWPPASGRCSVAEDEQGICGTVQVILDLPENQPHRADVCQDAGAPPGPAAGSWGRRSMRAAEATARECGRTLLMLDAVTGGDTARLYERLGWVRVGDVPGYALMPWGEPCSTTYYYRDLGS